MADNARGVHVSPGIYSREIDITYAVKSLGITTLGLVGETLRGPAFEPVSISNWREFTDIFGGTSTEKFNGTNYPKYELPYIAKSYLTESEQLEVVRVLGLCGYNAGPAWVITGRDEKTNQDIALAVIRSRGGYESYKRYRQENDDCICSTDQYDSLFYQVGEKKNVGTDCSKPKRFFEGALRMGSYAPLGSYGNLCSSFTLSGTVDTNFSVSSTNMGRFKLFGATGAHTQEEIDLLAYPDSRENVSGYFEYSLSFNPGDNDYIINVLGTDPTRGSAPIYVESLYDVALTQYISSGYITMLNSGLTFYNVSYPTDYCKLDAVAGLVDKAEEDLSRKNVSQRYLADFNAVNKLKVTCHPYNFETNVAITLADVFTNDAYKDLRPIVSDECLRTIGPKLKRNKHGRLSTDYNIDSASTSVMCDAINTRKDIIEKIHNGTAKALTVSDLIDVNDYIWDLAELILEDTDGTILKPVNDVTELSGWTAVSGDPVECYMTVGQIYTVIQKTDKQTNQKSYWYRYYPAGSFAPKNSGYTQVLNADMLQNQKDLIGPETGYADLDAHHALIVKNNYDGFYYRLYTDDDVFEDDEMIYSGGTYTGWSGRTDVYPVTCDLNNYKSSYRYASTPWIVSNLKGDSKKIEINKLFRFHTISDGNTANSEIKVSIENISPDDGYFDVVVRNITDGDEQIETLEKFANCSMDNTTKNYIALKIGSYDGLYESNSKYITVEVNESEEAAVSVPCGFLGYPMAQYQGLPTIGSPSGNPAFPTLKYNTQYDEDIKNRKQYFGLSTWVGVDIDTFAFKGNMAYIDDPKFMTNGFHLDSRLDLDGYETDEVPEITVDNVSGYKFDSVSTNARTSTLVETPIISDEDSMIGSIYEYKNLRKFTVYFYGGFDGWDVMRDYRSNTDDFKMSKYKGMYSTKSGEGYAFNKIIDPETIGLNQNGITSDYYAYLAGIRQFCNPESIDINVFATPGIDYVNNKLLVQEAIEMIEEERADSIYVVTTPDKPSGADDYKESMYTPDDAVYNLEETDIDSNYTCTYYPWVKYYDSDNKQYIFLPATKDVVRNMAQTDNTSYPWMAPAGLSRGNVDCVRAHYITKLSDEDTLYDGRINPVKTFASDGVKIWGQKNLQVADSQLNRIAVRRLLLRLRKLIAIGCLGLIFEPNDTTTKNSFLSIVTPILDNIKSNRGISDYRIEVDDSAEARARLELPAKIYIKPIQALEYITIDFIVTPEGVSFDDI